MEMAVNPAKLTCPVCGEGPESGSEDYDATIPEEKFYELFRDFWIFLKPKNGIKFKDNLTRFEGQIPTYMYFECSVCGERIQYCFEPWKIVERVIPYQKEKFNVHTTTA